MTVLKSHLNTSGSDFKERAAAFAVELAKLHERAATALRPESAKAVELARSRSKLLTGERIEALVDRGAAILEVAPFAGYDLYDGVPPGAGLRCCISRVAGRTCMIIANNPAIKGGTYFPLTIKKHLRAQEIALENRLPCVYLVDSGGAFLPLQDQVFPDRFHFGRIFYNQALMSSKGIPQLSVVLGSCTAGGAYVPAMSDEAIMVRGNASIFLGGPPLVKAATGEEVTAEELGGAEVHCHTSGVADHLAENEHDALETARRLVASLGDPDSAFPGFRRLHAEQSPEPPHYDPEELYGVVGTDLKKPIPAYEVLARLLDGSRFDEFKAGYGPTLKCGFGHIMGFRVGIIANDGILFSESALKGAHFIELCNQRLIPLLFIQNIVGFMVGKRYEHEGIAKHGAKMVTAVATARVPKCTLIVGGSFGAGNYSMCGRAYDPRFLFTWPNSRISVMGGPQAAQVLTQVRTSTAGRQGEAADAKRLAAMQEEILQKYEREGDPWYSSARLWDDGILDPVDTRMTLALSLATIGFDPAEQPSFGLFRM